MCDQTETNVKNGLRIWMEWRKIVLKMVIISDMRSISLWYVQGWKKIRKKNIY